MINIYEYTYNKKKIIEEVICIESHILEIKQVKAGTS